MKKSLLFALLFLGVLRVPAQQPSQPPASPKMIFESEEWVDYRVYDADKTGLPRVLLIGDSISGHYFHGLVAALKGKAYVSRVGSSITCCDPNYLATVKLALDQHPYDIIYFNNGLHGAKYTEAEYGQGLINLVAYLKARAPAAKLIWASSTQVRLPKPPFDKFAEINDRIKARNQFAADLMAKQNIPLDDLYALMEPHHDLMTDGVHYAPEGQAILTEHVTETILKTLNSK